MKKKSINQLIKVNFSNESFMYIEKMVENTKKYVKEEKKRIKKESFVSCLKRNCNVNNLINYNSQYGLNKEYLLDNYARRLVLNNLYLIGL